MLKNHEDPAARAGTGRAEITKPAGKNDFHNNTAAAIDPQVRRVLSCYAVSLSLALVVAEHAFRNGGDI